MLLSILPLLTGVLASAKPQAVEEPAQIDLPLLRSFGLQETETYIAEQLSTGFQGRLGALRFYDYCMYMNSGYNIRNGAGYSFVYPLNVTHHLILGTVDRLLDLSHSREIGEIDAFYVNEEELAKAQEYCETTDIHDYIHDLLQWLHPMRIVDRLFQIEASEEILSKLDAIVSKESHERDIPRFPVLTEKPRPKLEL